MDTGLYLIDCIADATAGISDHALCPFTRSLVKGDRVCRSCKWRTLQHFYGSERPFSTPGVGNITYFYVLSFLFKVTYINFISCQLLSAHCFNRWQSDPCWYNVFHSAWLRDLPPEVTTSGNTCIRCVCVYVRARVYMYVYRCMYVMYVCVRLRARARLYVCMCVYSCMCMPYVIGSENLEYQTQKPNSRVFNTAFDE